jgi:hypothetical protein
MDGGAAGYGAVYELDDKQGSWTDKVIYSFQGTNDGSHPGYGVIMAAPARSTVLRGKAASMGKARCVN